jgi:exodeoxyribonuclease V gamma subunit
LPSYIKALAIIAQRASNESTAEKEQTIKIAIYNGDISKDATSATVAMTPRKANEILQDIYTAAFGDESQLPYSKAVPASMLDASGITNIRAFKEKLLSESWKYFDKKTLFDPITDVGFDASDFTNQWKEATQKMRGLLQFTIDESESGKTAKKRKA